MESRCKWKKKMIGPYLYLELKETMKIGEIEEAYSLHCSFTE